MSKKYIIEEEELKDLLEAAHQLNVLEWSGVDNWWGYADSAVQQNYFLHHMPAHILETISKDNLEEVIENMDFDDLAQWDLNLYEEYKGE